MKRSEQEKFALVVAIIGESNETVDHLIEQVRNRPENARTWSLEHLVAMLAMQMIDQLDLPIEGATMLAMTILRLAGIDTTATVGQAERGV